MNRRDLEIFTAVADCLGFTAAAAKLHIAQSAVSIGIKKLETELGLQLLHRSGKQVSLTDEGVYLYRRADALLQDFQALSAEMKSLRATESGEVRVGIPTMLGNYYFPAILIAFKNRYPGLKVSIFNEGACSIQDLLSRGEIDLGSIVMGEVPDDLEVTPYLETELVACVANEHRFVGRSSIALEEFVTEPLILFGHGYFQRDMIANVCRQINHVPNVVFEANLVPLITSLVAENQGVTSFLRLVPVAQQGVRQIPFAPAIQIRLGLARKKGRPLSRANEAFLKFVAESSESHVQIEGAMRA